MTSIISISFVFKNDKATLKSQVMQKIIDTFNLHEDSILICNDKNIIYSKMSIKQYECLTSSEYSNILTMCNFLNIRNQKLNLVYYQASSFFCMQIQMYEDPYKKSFKNIDLEQNIIDYIINSNISFDYVVCENGCEINLSPEEIFDEEFTYSILIVPDKTNFIIKKGKYLPSGVERNK